MTNLLPNRIKRIGAIITLLVFVFFIVIRETTQLVTRLPVLKSAFEILLLLGLLLVIISREKVEDEFVRFCRLRAATLAFVAGIFSFILNGLLTAFDLASQVTTFGCLLSEAMTYLMFFNITIRGGLQHDK